MEQAIRRHECLLDLAHRRTYKKRSFICLQGDEPKELYIVASGTVKILIDGHIIHFACEDDTFGTFEHSSKCNHSAIAVNDAVVYAIGQNKLSRYTNESPELQAELLSRMGKIRKALSKHISSFKRGLDGEVKLARFLLSFKDRQKVASDELLEFVLPMPRKDIADYLGLTGETVARIFSRFVDNDLIVRGGDNRRRRVRIRNIEELKRVAKMR